MGGDDLRKSTNAACTASAGAGRRWPASTRSIKGGAQSTGRFWRSIGCEKTTWNPSRADRLPSSSRPASRPARSRRRPGRPGADGVRVDQRRSSPAVDEDSLETYYDHLVEQIVAAARRHGTARRTTSSIRAAPQGQGCRVGSRDRLGRGRGHPVQDSHRGRGGGRAPDRLGIPSLRSEPSTGR